MLSLLAATAFTLLNIAYPVLELGDCSMLSACQEFCELEINREACTAFGEERGLTVRRGVFVGESFEGEVLAAEISYPIAELGGCSSKEECKAFCDLELNHQVCFDFGKAHGLKSGSEASPDGKPALGAVFPVAELGNCGSVVECRAYCAEEKNRTACAAFAKKMGIGQGGTSNADPSKGSEALGISFPIAELGGCGNPTACKAHCDRSENRAVCESFAKAHGLVVEVNGPGGCKNQSECESFCNAPENRETCMKWAKENGMDVGGGPGGPGGCQGDEECQKYCQEHSDDPQCQQGMKEMQEYCEKHPDEEKCQRMGGMGGSGGPGGCQSEAECRKYCEEHPDDTDCKKMGGPPGGGSGGPGGCQSEEECRKYCEDNSDNEDCLRSQEDYCQKNPDECSKSGSGPNGGGPDGMAPPGAGDLPGDFLGPGPGGCASAEACRLYCESHPLECSGQPQ